MSIFPEKRNGVATGRLVVEVRVGGKVLKRRADTKKEAKALEAQMKAGLLTEATEGKPMTLKELGEACKGLWDGHKDEANSQRKLRKVVETLGEKTLVKDITSAVVDTFHDKLRAQGLSNPTLNRYNAVLSRCLEWAAKRDHITKVPEITWHHEPKTKFAWLQPEDEARVIEWLANPENVYAPETALRVSLAIRVLTLTGMRIGELEKVGPEHIDTKAETITALDTKTGDSRTQYLPKDLGEPLKRLKLDDEFPSYRAIQNLLYRARDALGLDPRLTIHSLRHSTATRLATKGVNHKVIMDYMGHKSMHTTNRYTHVNAETKKTAAQVLLEMARGAA